MLLVFFSNLRKYSFYVAILEFFFSLILLNHFSMHVFLLNKTLVLKNNVIKYKSVFDQCFEVRYLYPYLSMNFSIYYLVKYCFVFT